MDEKNIKNENENKDNTQDKDKKIILTNTNILKTESNDILIMDEESNIKKGVYDIDLSIFSNKNYFKDDLLDTKDTFKIDYNLVKDLNYSKKNIKKIDNISYDNQMLNQFKKMQTNKAITCSSRALLEKANDVMKKNNLYKIKNYFVGTGIFENYD